MQEIEKLFAASHLGLFYLPMSHYKDARLIWGAVMIPSFRTDRSGQTVQTQIRLLL